MTVMSSDAPADTARPGGGPTVLVRESRHRSDPVRQRRRERLAQRALAVVVPAVAVALWQLAASRSWIDERTYPAPSTIVNEGWDLFRDGALRDDIYATLKRVLGGYFLGLSVGFVVGTAMGVSKWVRSAFEASLNALYVVPKLAMLPIFLTIFGFGEAPLIVLVAVTVFFFVWIETMEAMASVPEGFREAARAFGVSRGQMFRHVLLPATLPQLFVAARIAMGVAVLVIVAAEFVVGGSGLGYLIFNSRALFAIDRTYVGIVTVALMGVVLAGIVSWIGRRLTPWVTDHSGRRR